MITSNAFPPQKQRGLVVQAVLLLFLLALTLFAALSLRGATFNLAFAFFVLLLLFSLIPVPLLVYRFYALLRAEYTLDRENLHLVWGMRVEDIPISDVEWVRPANSLSRPLVLPWFGIAGSLLGKTHNADLGTIEFLAAEAKGLLLIATARQIYAISPADPAGFMQAFQRVMEMGSLAQTQGHSQYPSFVISDAWQNQLVRSLWLFGLFVNIGLFLWVSINLPGLQSVSLGFDPSGLPLEVVPRAQLILLPLLSVFLFTLGWLTGLFFYRRPDLRLIATLLWASGTFSSVLFLLAVSFLLNTPHNL
jgi:hypothetical protein